MFEEEVRRFVKQRAARQFRAAADADQVAVEEFLDHPVASDAADRLDGGLGDGLAVGDDGEGFHRRAAHPLGFAAGEKLADELAVFNAGEDFPAFRALDDGEGALALLIGLVQLRDGSRDFFRGCRGEV